MRATGGSCPPLSLAAWVLSTFVLSAQAATAAPFGGPNDNAILTPIGHAIMIVGGNRPFDHVLGTYLPHPLASATNPDMPASPPASDDMMDYFTF